MSFREAVDDCALSDIKLHGHPFTWTKSPGTKRVLEERLDMAMGNSEWLQRFPEVKLTNLLTSHSDHTPILLDIIPSVRQRYNYSFKFENCWLLEDDIEEVVVDGWGGTMGLELGGRVLNCSTKLQSWGRRKRVRFKEEIDQCVRTLEGLRAQPNGMMRTQYVTTREKHARLLVQEEAFWKQRAKMHWLKEGDMNTKFFHTSAIARGKVKKASKLRTVDRTTATSQEDMCNVAHSYFKQLFSANAGVHEHVLDLMSQCVSIDDNTIFTSPITKEELHRALFQMQLDKSPGPDGFNLAFYQRFWHVCGDDIFQAVVSWMDRGYFPTNLTETNICLIPKCEDPDNMKDIRPISLCNVLCKMVSKLLANRLKRCLDKCVSEEQSVFVEGRSILDNTLIATEVILSMKRKTKGWRGELALKIDISKAYDKVDWGFLRGVLMRMGSSEKWIH